MAPLVCLYHRSNTNIQIRHMCCNCRRTRKRKSVHNSNTALTAWRKASVTLGPEYDYTVRRRRRKLYEYFEQNGNVKNISNDNGLIFRHVFCVVT